LTVKGLLIYFDGAQQTFTFTLSETYTVQLKSLGSELTLTALFPGSAITAWLQPSPALGFFLSVALPAKPRAIRPGRPKLELHLGTECQQFVTDYLL
jgi:hypothetical protein